MPENPEITPHWTTDEGFTQLVKTTRDQFVRQASNKVGPNHAEDITQEALLRTWRVRETAKTDNPTAYIGRAIITVAIDHHKLSANNRTQPYDSEDLPHIPNEEDPARTAVAELLSSLFKTHPDSAHILLAVDAFGTPLNQYAKDQGIPDGTAKARLHRARKRLREQLKREAANEQEKH